MPMSRRSAQPLAGHRRVALRPPAQTVQSFFQDRRAVGVAAAFLDVGEVCLVRLHARRRGGPVLILPSREPAPRTLPDLGYSSIGGEAGPRLMPVRAPEGHPDPRSGLAAFGFAHRAGAHPAAADGVATA